MSNYHIFLEEGERQTLDDLLRGDMKNIWLKSLSNELGRTAQRNSRVKGNDTLDFIPREEVPKGKRITYANFICDVRPTKSEIYCVRMTIGGDRLHYQDDTTSPAASIIDTKLLLNSVISDTKLGAKFLTLDVKDYFLQTILKTSEYMRIHPKYFPPDILKLYNIQDLIAADNYVYCKIKKGFMD
mmetsp:Transcript_1689/g.2424  ORF Transcript_1689/g.2424 Transcript_1689/m.2424 type:complete len:185 (-) Transcript_1689:1101-1655(-)